MTDVTSGGSLVSSRWREWPERIGLVPRWGRVGKFVAIAAQLALLMVLLRLFEIEPGSGLLRILPLVFIGFVVHAALPLPWRLPFFLLLSIAAILMVLGPVAGVLLVLVGLVLIGVCHLPVALSTRVLLLVMIGAALAALRAGWFGMPSALTSPLALPGLPKLVLPVLGSMFMFRLVIYLYDLRHEERARAKGGPAAAAAAAKPASVWARLSYFFLLPNVCFLIFPVVDYRTYRRTYYDTEPGTIYQKGVWWICLGLVYLLAHRLVYHYVVPAPEEVQGLGGVVRFMVSSYLIYLRVVGQFHLITGLLCLFGFNLPPAHRFYLLASSFTDFWRRARIDWKDFMVKIFYYPTLVPLQRRWGATPALVASTIAVFIVTWLLHSYQWFWLRGDWRLSSSDGVFWTIIGGCVLVNSVLEARPGRSRAKAAAWAVGPAVLRALKVMGMLIFMCVLWSYWSTPSVRIWLSFLSAAKESGPGSYALLVGALLALIGAGVLAQFIAARNAASPGRSAAPRAWKQPRSRLASLWQPAAVAASAALLLIVRVPATNAALGAPMVSVVTTLSTNQLNAVDQERHDRGYYEVLLDEPRSTVAWMAASGAPTSEGAEAAVGSETEGPEASVPTDTLGPEASGAAEPQGPEASGASAAEPKKIPEAAAATAGTGSSGDAKKVADTGTAIRPEAPRPPGRWRQRDGKREGNHQPLPLSPFRAFATKIRQTGSTTNGSVGILYINAARSPASSNHFQTTVITRMETAQTDVKATIKDYILREFLPGEGPESLDDKTPLITGGVLDSIATVKLIAFLEERFGVQIEPHEMNADYLNFLPDIAAIVESRQE